MEESKRDWSAKEIRVEWSRVSIAKERAEQTPGTRRGEKSEVKKSEEERRGEVTF